MDKIEEEKQESDEKFQRNSEKNMRKPKSRKSMKNKK
jgi:hypothetical protein